jgi:hypothetical protein
MLAEPSEIVDLALTQAIERYAELERGHVLKLIPQEWPEQIAVLLVDFFFKTTCGNRVGMPELIAMERENGMNNYFIPACSCELAEWRENK